MLKKSLMIFMLVAATFLTGCASIPMMPEIDDTAQKSFSMPSAGTAGLYIYRNSSFGGALLKTVFVDDVLLGETAPNTYFYKEISPGAHKLSTESEFSNNDITLDAESGKNYYVRQYIKFGVFVGGAGLEIIPEDEGKKGVLECKLAKQTGKLGEENK